MRRIILAVVALSLALIAAASVGGYWFERPSIVHVAVPRDSDEFKLLAAYAQTMAREHEDARFRLVGTDDMSASAVALDGNEADLAVVRSDIGMPRHGQTAVILQRSAAVFVAPAGATFTSINDLKGHNIGFVASRLEGDSDRKVLDMLLRRYDVGGAATTVVPLAEDDLPSALTSHRVDVVFVLGPPTSAVLTDAVAAVAAAADGPPVFIPIAEGKAIEQVSPAYEAIEVPRGAYGGAVPRPLADLKTISVSTRLVASDRLTDSLVGDITRIIFARRPTIAARLPTANLVEAPATDKDQALPIHPGAAAYLDGDQETFLDKYSDFIYIGAMVVSVLASAAAAVAGRLTATSQARVEDMFEKLIELLAQARAAETRLVLDALELEADGVLVQSHRSGLLRTLDAHRVAGLGVALDQVRLAIRERRRVVDSQARVLPFEPTIRVVGE